MIALEEKRRYIVSLRRHERNVYLVCAQLVAEGIWPGPKALVQRLHGHDGHMLNGREARVRRAFFEHHDFRCDPVTGRWYLPTKMLWRRIGQGPVMIVGPDTVPL